MRPARMHCRRGLRGAALLSAMLTVTLVATFAASALWQQWRSIEVETAERARVQSAWILTGALDWARLILREDARSGGPDHLAEPWAVPLEEARLSTFLAVDRQATDTEREAFLSGQITDLQGRLNVMNLVQNEKISDAGLGAFGRLFDRLGLPREPLTDLASALLRASLARTAGAEPLAPLMPQRVEQLPALGLPPAVLAALRPYITLLPVTTKVNLNTASAEVIHAAIPDLDMADAQKLVSLRDRQHFRTLDDVTQQMPGLQDRLNGTEHDVASRFFEVRGRLRLDDVAIEERSVVQRDGLNVRTLWRERVAALGRPVAAAPLQ